MGHLLPATNAFLRVLLRVTFVHSEYQLNATIFPFKYLSDKSYYSNKVIPN